MIYRVVVAEWDGENVGAAVLEAQVEQFDHWKDRPVWEGRRWGTAREE